MGRLPAVIGLSPPINEGGESHACVPKRNRACGSACMSKRLLPLGGTTACRHGSYGDSRVADVKEVLASVVNFDTGFYFFKRSLAGEEVRRFEERALRKVQREVWINPGKNNNTSPKRYSSYRNSKFEESRKLTYGIHSLQHSCG